MSRILPPGSNQDYGDNVLPAPQVSGGGTGTVTSVGLTMPGGYTVTGSPVTTSGTLAVTGPLTTKGDVLAFSTVNARLPVGADGLVLSADSTQTLGLKYITVNAGGAGSHFNWGLYIAGQGCPI